MWNDSPRMNVARVNANCSSSVNNRRRVYEDYFFWRKTWLPTNASDSNRGELSLAILRSLSRDFAHLRLLPNFFFFRFDCFNVSRGLSQFPHLVVLSLKFASCVTSFTVICVPLRSSAHFCTLLHPFCLRLGLARSIAQSQTNETTHEVYDAQKWPVGKPPPPFS